MAHQNQLQINYIILHIVQYTREIQNSYNNKKNKTPARLLLVLEARALLLARLFHIIYDLYFPFSTTLYPLGCVCVCVADAQTHTYTKHIQNLIISTESLSLLYYLAIERACVYALLLAGGPFDFMSHMRLM